MMYYWELFFIQEPEYAGLFYGTVDEVDSFQRKMGKFVTYRRLRTEDVTAGHKDIADYNRLIFLREVMQCH